MIKILYTFEVPKEIEVEKQEDSINEAGEKVTVTKKVKELSAQKFYLARPSRYLQEEAELFRAVKFSEAVKRGVLTHDLLSKRLKNDEGLLSQGEKEKYTEMYNNLYALHLEVQKFKPENERNEEDKKNYNELIEKIKKIRQEIRDFENDKSSLFNFTAETYARNKLVFWWLMFLCYQTGKNGEPEPLFPGKDFESKAQIYDIFEEKNDLFMNTIIQKFMYYTTLWFLSEVSNPEQFAKLVADAEKEDGMTDPAVKPEI